MAFSEEVLADFESGLVGFGILTPFRRGPSDIVSAGGAAAVRSMVDTVLTTAAASAVNEGELPWRGDFGSRLHLLLHRKNDATTAELGRVWITEALGRWLPFLRLKSVTPSRDLGPEGERNVLSYRLVYDVLASQGGNVVLADVSQDVVFPG